MPNELIKKVKLQSVIIVIVLIGAGCFLLAGSDAPTKTAEIFGCISLGLGFFFAIFSYIRNNEREQYESITKNERERCESIIKHYENLITSLQSSGKHVEQTYRNAFGGTQKSEEGGQYEVVGSKGGRTPGSDELDSQLGSF
ncbi:MAG: hypothetical protein OXN83_00385 [Oligoflexia bacterium]|nr:hypothetical protein [Oligoflexia bacterium]